MPSFMKISDISSVSLSWLTSMNFMSLNFMLYLSSNSFLSEISILSSKIILASVTSPFSSSWHFKGGLISKKHFCGSHLQKKVPNHYPEHYPPKGKMPRIVIWHLFLEIWAKVEKLSEIKLPLAEMQAAVKQADSHLKGNILELT